MQAENTRDIFVHNKAIKMNTGNWNNHIGTPLPSSSSHSVLPNHVFLNGTCTKHIEVMYDITGQNHFYMNMLFLSSKLGMLFL